MCTKNHNHTRHRSWDMEWDRQNILLFWAIFCPFTSLLTPKIKIGKKTTTTGDIIFLHVCTINENHMTFGSWDIRCDEQNFLPFWAIFWPLTLLTIQHIKILKKWEKKAWRYHDFTLKYHKWRSYDLWFFTYRAGQTFLLPFSAIFCLYPTNNLKNQNFEKTKKCFEISFYTCVPQMTIIWCVSWDMEGKIIFLSFRTIFRPFTPLTTLKIKTLKK